MARTTQMKLIDLMVLKQDIVSVIEYIGKNGSFQFQKKYSLSEKNPSEEKNDASTNYEIYEQLRNAAVFLSLSELPIDIKDTKVPDEETIEAARKFLVSFDELQTQLDFARENLSKIENTYSEALAFANLQVSYSELEHLSFLSLK